MDLKLLLTNLTHYLIDDDSNTINETSLPLILLWTTFHHRHNDLGFLTRRMTKCPKQCAISNNRAQLKQAQVVMFHGTDMNHRELPETAPHQLKLFMMRESPGRMNQFYNNWDKIPMSFFNTTMTYRNDSDYHFPYFNMLSLERRPEAPKFTSQDIDEAITKKKHAAFSLISHCGAPSFRDKIIKRLANYSEVNRYGHCGKPCDQECEQEALESHFFYMSLENTICDQYVTEKFARFKKLVVPITFTRSVVPDFVPFDSYIAVDDFCSIEELGVYLNYLMNNKTAYKSYFSWTQRYSSEDDLPILCDLCADAHSGIYKTTDYSQFKDIIEFFNPKQCFSAYGKELIQDRCEFNFTAKNR